MRSRCISKYVDRRGQEERLPSCSRTTPPASPAATTIVKSFPEAGGTIVAQEPTQFGQTDFRPALLKLADAKPEVMLVSITAGAAADGAAIQAA